MNNLFLENKRYFYLFLGLFFIALVAFYFLFSRPQYQERNDKKMKLAQIEEEINLLNAEQSSEGPSESELDDYKLLEKIPNSYEIEKFLLTLNEIELVSDSRFTGLELLYDGNLPELITEEAENEENTDQEDDSETDAEEVETDAEEVEEDSDSSQELFTFEEQPENMHVLTARVKIASPNYQSFQKLLKEVELQKRIMFVSDMEFTKPAEQKLVLEESSNETIEMTADITTFFYSEE